MNWPSADSRENKYVLADIGASRWFKVGQAGLALCPVLRSIFDSQLEILQVVSGSDGDESSQIRSAEDYVLGVAGKLNSSGLTVSAKTLVDDPLEQINNEAEVKTLTLVAMSTCGHSGLNAGKLGGVVEGVLGGPPIH